MLSGIVYLAPQTIGLVLVLWNLLLAGSVFLMQQAGASDRRWAWARLIQGAAMVLVLCTPVWARVAGLALLVAGLALETAAIWKAAQRPRLTRLLRATALTAVVLALIMLAASVLTLTGYALAWSDHALGPATTRLALLVLMLISAVAYLLAGRERLQAELARLETVDMITDCPNRRGLYQALVPWMALARRPGAPTALLVLDLDNFKRVNDGYGHPVGDVVLRHVADLCKRQLRDSDLLGRLVGGEFALLLPRTGSEEAVLVAERIRAAIAATPVKSARAMITVTASFGVTNIRPDDSPVTLFERAGAAMRTAKQAGRNCIEQAPQAPHNAA